MKKIFLAAVTEENKKYYSFVIPIRTGENIKPILERYKNTPVFHLCESRKQADDLVIFWNKCYKNNGTYLFDSPSFNRGAPADEGRENIE